MRLLIATVILFGFYFIVEDVTRFVVRQKITNPHFSYLVDSVIGNPDPQEFGFLERNREKYQYFEEILIGRTIEGETHLKRETVPLKTGIDVAVWMPKGDVVEPLGVVLHFPGGGFVKHVPRPFGNSSLIPKLFRNKPGWMVVDVPYRVVPENTFEDSLEDAYAAYDWILDVALRYNIDLSKIVVVGESAGTVHASYVTDRALNRVPVFQLLLVVPVARKPVKESFSVRQNGFGYNLDWEEMVFYHEMVDITTEYTYYIADLAFKGFPKTKILVARYDPLYDDGLLVYFDMEKAGVDVSFHVLEGMHVSYVVHTEPYEVHLLAMLTEAEQIGN